MKQKSQEVILGIRSCVHAEEHVKMGLCNGAGRGNCQASIFAVHPEFIVYE
jgi:hypothetical protein